MASRPKTSSFLNLTEVLDAIDGFDDELQFGEEDDFDMDIITTELDEDDELEEIESVGHNFSYYSFTYIHRCTSIIKKWNVRDRLWLLPFQLVHPKSHVRLQS